MDEPNLQCAPKARDFTVPATQRADGPVQYRVHTANARYTLWFVRLCNIGPPTCLGLPRCFLPWWNLSPQYDVYSTYARYALTYLHCGVYIARLSPGLLL